MESNGSPYYDQAELWREPAHYTDECIRIIESLVPCDVRSILDVGCGNGAITNRLTARFRTIGLDSSREALLHLQGARLLAESAAIPLRDQSVDLVLLSNVLEHLPAAVFSHTVKEAMRIARRYLLVVSPHDENLQFSQVKCDDCGCIYHRNYHLRSLTLADIDRVFGQGFEMSAYTFWGEPWPQYDRRLWELKQHLAEGWSRWPLAVCPLCGGKPGTKEPHVKSEKVAMLLDDLNDAVLFDRRESLVKQPVESEVAVLFMRTASVSRINQGVMDHARQAGGKRHISGCLLSDKAFPESFPSTLRIRLRVKKRVDIYMEDRTACRSTTLFHSLASYLCLGSDSVWGERYLLDGKIVRNYGYSSNPRKQALFVMPRFTEEAFTLTVSYKDMSSEPAWLSVYDKQQGYIPLGQLEDKKDGRWKETTFVVPAAIHPAREGFFFNFHGALTRRDNFYAIARICVSGGRDRCLEGTVGAVGTEEQGHYLLFSCPIESPIGSDCEWLLEMSGQDPVDQRVQVHLWDGDSFFFVDRLPVQEPHDVCVKVPTWWINQYLGKLGMDQAAMMTMGDQTHELDLLRQELLRKQSGLAQAQKLLNSRLIRQAVWIKQLLKRVLRRMP